MATEVLVQTRVQTPFHSNARPSLAAKGAAFPVLTPDTWYLLPLAYCLLRSSRLTLFTVATVAHSPSYHIVSLSRPQHGTGTSPPANVHWAAIFDPLLLRTFLHFCHLCLCHLQQHNPQTHLPQWFIAWWSRRVTPTLNKDTETIAPFIICHNRPLIGNSVPLRLLITEPVYSWFHPCRCCYELLYLIQPFSLDWSVFRFSSDIDSIFSHFHTRQQRSQ